MPHRQLGEGGGGTGEGKGGHVGRFPGPGGGGGHPKGYGTLPGSAPGGHIPSSQALATYVDTPFSRQGDYPRIFAPFYLEAVEPEAPRQPECRLRGTRGDIVHNYTVSADRQNYVSLKPVDLPPSLRKCSKKGYLLN
jgi:hypothetical protein